MLCLLLMSMASAALSLVSSLCTGESSHRALKCTASLNGPARDTSGSPYEFINQGDASQAVLLCQNGTFLTVLSCMEREVEDCKNDNSDAGHYVRNMIDIDKARRAITYFCTNIKVYTSHTKCISQHLPEQDVCLMEAKKNFETQAGATANMDSIMRFQCILYQAVVDCANQVNRAKCSSEAARLVMSIVLGFQPPICEAVTGRIEVDYSDIDNKSVVNYSLINNLLLFTNVLIIIKVI